MWIAVRGSTLRQGDYLPGCRVPVFPPDFGVREGDVEIPGGERDLIVVTQSCDLDNPGLQFVALIPICPIAEFEEANPAFSKKGRWNEVREGRIEGLHLLGSPEQPADNLRCLVVDFREIYSLPVLYTQAHAIRIAHRWRLKSPYLEHFSQAFARFYMRVGLPSPIPEFL